MSGTGAIAVLRLASQKMGDTRFTGSVAEAIRLAGLDLDDNHSIHDAAILMAQVRDPVDMLKPLSKKPKIQWPFARKRMCADVDSAIAKLEDMSPTLRAQRGRTAARAARNWANQQPNEQARDAEVARTFAAAHADAVKALPGPGHTYVRAPRPEKPRLITTGVGSRATPEGGH